MLLDLFERLGTIALQKGAALVGKGGKGRSIFVLCVRVDQVVSGLCSSEIKILGELELDEL
jgi:shikimate kinase